MGGIRPGQFFFNIPTMSSLYLWCSLKDQSRYQTLTLPEEDASNCIFVNGTLIRVQASEAPESDKVLYFKFLSGWQ